METKTETVMENEIWKGGLKQNGLYYDGVVSSADDRLEIYKRMTVTSWGTRTSSNPEGNDKMVRASYTKS